MHRKTINIFIYWTCFGVYIRVRLESDYRTFRQFLFGNRCPVAPSDPRKRNAIGMSYSVAIPRLRMALWEGAPGWHVRCEMSRRTRAFSAPLPLPIGARRRRQIMTIPFYKVNVSDPLCCWRFFCSDDLRVCSCRIYAHAYVCVWVCMVREGDLSPLNSLASPEFLKKGRTLLG